MPPKVVDLSAMQELVSPHFLVVDDNAVNRKLTLKALMSLWPKAQVAVASGGEEALSWLDQHEVDLVLLDRVMPHIDGLETARRIRAHTKPRVARVAILGLTAYEVDENNAQCMTAGMDDVATKPITIRCNGLSRLKSSLWPLLLRMPSIPQATAFIVCRSE